MPSKTAPDLLRSLSNAISNGKHSKAEKALNKLESIYSELEVKEQVQQTKALKIRNNTTTEPKTRERSNSFAQQILMLDLARAGVLSSGAMHLADPSQSDTDSLVEQLNNVASQEEKLVTSYQSLSSDLSNISLPATLVITSLTQPEGRVPKGSAVEFDLTVENVGDENSDSVTISQTSDYITPKKTNVGRLDGSEKQRVTFSGTPVSEGQYTITFTATSDQEKTQRNVRFSVVNKLELIHTMKDLLDSLESQITSSTNHGHGRPYSLVKKVENASEKLDDAEKFVNNQKGKQANNMIRASTNILGAALNSMHSKGKGHGKQSLDSDLRVAIISQLEAAIDQGATARNASI